MDEDKDVDKGKRLDSSAYSPVSPIGLSPPRPQLSTTKLQGSERLFDFLAFLNSFTLRGAVTVREDGWGKKEKNLPT